MTNRFVYSSMTEKTIFFKVQIGDFSKYACKGCYTSPEFDGDECKSQWGLLVHVYDGADHENFIDVRLQRHEYVIEEQFVSVKTSIVNCFGFNVLKNERKFSFGESNEFRILAVAKEQLKGLKKMLYLPKDTLTLQCSLSIHESVMSAYKEKETFLNNIPRCENYFSEYFSESRLVEKAKDYFVRKIANFSVISYGYRAAAPEFQSECLEGKWSLVVYNTTDYNNSWEYLDIRLMLRDSYQHQLVKVRLSVTDPLHTELISKEKFAYFTSSGEVQLLSSAEMVISSWYGFRKKQLVPEDELTFRCEMVLYEQIDHTFDRKEDFDRSIETSGYTPMQYIPYFVVFCFMIYDILNILSCLCLAMISFIWYNMLSFIWDAILSFIWQTILDILKISACVCLITMFFSYIKNKAEGIIRRRKNREIGKRLAEKKRRIMLEHYEEYVIDS